MSRFMLVFDEVLKWMCAIVLFSMMTITFLDVVGRGAFRKPVPGSFELIEILLVIFISTSLPLASRWGAHITLDLINHMIGERWRHRLDRVMNLLTAFVLLGSGWRMLIRAARIRNDGVHSAVLAIPYWPFAYYMAILLGVMGLVHLLYAVTRYQPLIELEREKAASEGGGQIGDHGEATR